MKTYDVMNARNENVERALDKAPNPTNELADEQLNEAAGLSVRSGVKAGAFPTAVNN